jgi:hypothetical protein
MSKPDKMVKMEENSALLTESERLSLNEFLESRTNPLGPDKNAKLYSLYLNGNTCEEIQKLNPSLTLGQVLHARVIGDWDIRKDKYQETLLQKTEERHRQVALETIGFISDLLAVTNIRYGSKLKKFIRDEQEGDLGELAISLRQYKEMAELHQKLAGTEGQKRQIVTGEVTVNHNHKTEVFEAEEDPEEMIQKLLNGKS